MTAAAAPPPPLASWLAAAGALPAASVATAFRVLVRPYKESWKFRGRGEEEIPSQEWQRIRCRECKKTSADRQQYFFVKMQRPTDRMAHDVIGSGGAQPVVPTHREGRCPQEYNHKQTGMSVQQGSGRGDGARSKRITG